MEAWVFFDEFILTSGSSSSDSEDDYLQERVKRNRIENFVEIVDKFSNEEFQRNFRLKRNTFNKILNLIGPKIGTMDTSIGRNRIPAKDQLLITIWYFATPDSYRSICGRFNIGMATGISVVRRVTEAINSVSPSVIKWPDAVRREEIIRHFENKGFPSTIGCVDGSYIPIPMPKEEGRAYICRKNFPCINLTAVCDHEMLFTYVYAGEAGSVHDAGVLRNSELWSFMNEQVEEMFPDDVHLLGDKAYPITKQLLTPYRDNGHLTRAQQNFNYNLSSVRSTIERCFGLLKKRFRILKFMDVRRLDWIPPYILACCVLHNLCILENDVLEIEVVDNPEEDLFERNYIEERIEVHRERGMAKRDRLCQELNRM